MKDNSFDLVIVGGGLAGGLLLYRLHQVFPGLKIKLVESGSRIGGEHTWSFHQTDLTKDDFTWLKGLVSRTWRGYLTSFPQYERTLSSNYHSIASAEFHQKIMSACGGSVLLGEPATKVGRNSIALASGKKLKATVVLDARGWDASESVPVAYQKFLGMRLKLEAPHALRCPVIMDVTCPQVDGFRFFYLLPWESDELLVEDTHYSANPTIQREAYREEILRYCSRRGWTVKEVGYEEMGSLPLPLGGELGSWADGVPRIGLRGGLFHATTGYSFPDAVRFASFFVSLVPLKTDECFMSVRRYAERHWRRQGFYRLLNRMMFWGARPTERYRLLEHFYKLKDTQVARFYSGQLTLPDRLKLFAGKPPMPVRDALRAAFYRGRMYGN